MTILANRDDLDAEACREKRPSGRPSVALLETANSQNGLLAVSPAHAGAFQPLGSERLARRFDHAAPNGKPSRLITGVVHAVPLVLEVHALGVEQFATSLASLATHLSRQPGKLGDHVVRPTRVVSEHDPQAFILCTARDRLLAVVRRQALIGFQGRGFNNSVSLNFCIPSPP